LPARQMEDAMAHGDVIITVLGAAAVLAGLVLVFLGIVVTTFQSYPGNIDDALRSGFRQDSILTLIPFVLGVACVCLSAVWLLLPENNESIYVAAVAAFFFQLASLLLAAVLVTRRVLWT
jgi:hypothetical protein